MMRLILDTSSQYCVLAIAEGNKVRGWTHFIHENQLSGRLVPAIEGLLKDNHLTPKDLKSIAAGMGPGSYSGTRVGVAVAKSLSFALKIPFTGFCSLAAFLPETEGSIALILPTRFESFFWATFTQEEGICLTGTALLSESELISQIKEIKEICCTDPAKLPACLQNLCRFAFMPHVEKLSLFLHQNNSLPCEELIYLHTP